MTKNRGKEKGLHKLFAPIWEGEDVNNQRYGVTFNTANTHYYFDTGTGKIVMCSSEERSTIDKILNNVVSVKEICAKNSNFNFFIKKEGLFSDKQWSFIIPTKEEFEYKVKGNCEQIVLELTEACNLRCKYCVYNESHPDYRGFSAKNMDFQVAKKSIDNVLSDFKGTRFALTFYGGEPLLNFDLMKKCIDYVNDRYGYIDDLSYGFTTNLTLLTKEMIDYFKTVKDIDIVCSIDGPKELHDMFRKDGKGKGTFEKVIHNFKLLLDQFYCMQEQRTLSINCVMTPPYKKSKLFQVKDFFYRELGIPKDIACNYSYVDMGKSTAAYDTEKNSEFLDISPLEEWAADDFIENDIDSNLFNLINIELYRVANRNIANDGFIDRSHLHGNCVPGQRRLYVTVDGEYKTCEKVGTAPSIGNCYEGYNTDRVYDLYVKGYADYFQNLCNNCWARTMCGVCYESSMKGGNNHPYISGKLCETSKKLLKEMFINYYRLYETDRERLRKALETVDIV